MDYDKLIENVYNKINSGNNFFSKEDFIIISNMPFLLKNLIIAIDNHVFPLNYEIASFLVETIGLEKIDSTYLNTHYEIAKSYIDNEYYDSHFIYDYAKTFGLSDELVAKLNNYVKEKFKDKNYMFTKAVLDNQFLNQLLDYKRYDVIDSFDISESAILNYSICELDEKTYNRIVNEWPFDKLPQIIINNQKNKEIFDYTKEDLNTLIYDCSNSNKEKKTKLFNIILDKLNNYDSLDFLTDNSRFKDILFEMYNSDDDKTTILSICKKLVDKNYLEAIVYLYINKCISKEEIIDKINYNVDNNLNFSPQILDCININPFSNDNYIKLFLDYGHLDSLIKYEEQLTVDNESRPLEKYIDYIISKIRNNDEFYDKYLTKLEVDLTNYEEIFKEIISKGKIKSINLFNSKNIDNLFEDILSLDNSNNGFGINLDLFSSDKEKITKYLLEHKAYNIIITSNLLTPNFIKNNEDLIIESLDNLCFADEIIKLYNLFDNPKILSKLLTNKILVNKLLDKITHNDEIDDLYNHNNFLLLKDFLVQKYNLNRNHFEELEQRFGARIIRYIDNENLHNIINLDESTFEKILNLFPKVEYTIKDIEASYESLIQFAYSIEKKEDISIFPSFIHAIEDKNEDEIQKIREKLIIYTNKDFLNDILSKYNIENINYTYELIDLIINKYGTIERQIYLDILHDITNEYITTSRKNYHNNHYFEEKYREYSNFFENYLNSIDNLDNNVISIVSKVITTLDKNIYKDIFEKYNISNDFSHPFFLMESIIEKVRNKETRDKYLPVLKEIIDKYYEKQRNKYLKQIDIREELSIPYELEEKSKNNEIIKHIAKNCDKYENNDGKLLLDVVIDNLKKKGIDSCTVIDCVQYFKGKKDLVSNIDKTKLYLKAVIEEINYYIRNNDIYNAFHWKINKDELAKTLDKKYLIKRIYRNPNKIDPYQMLINLNINLLKNNLFNNDEMYKQLQDLMKRKKLQLLPNNLKPIIERTGISSDYSNIASFINYFGPILEMEKKRYESLGKDVSSIFSGLSSILMNAETFSSVSSVYSLILTDKDAKLIKSNPGPNGAIRKLNKNERLDEAVNLTIQNYQRKEITVPPINTNVYVNSDKNKEINVIVGNFTDSSILTLGERTGACMRIGGVGESLYNFCLQNKNGFHIRFIDTDTHEFISRVSGFRNGNTVFLNELRYSCNKEKYSDEELYNACVEVSRLIIENSKNSNYPIDNVVIANEYAVNKLRSEEVYLNISNNKQGLPKFYSDVGNSVIVLATTSKDKKFVDVNFNKKNIPIYKPCRNKPEISTDSNKLVSKINRVSAIKKLMNGAKIEDIESVKLDDGIICGIVADDWYIYVDSDRNVKYDLIDIDERAKEELTSGLDIIQNVIASVIGENKYGDEINYGYRY